MKKSKLEIELEKMMRELNKKKKQLHLPISRRSSNSRMYNFSSTGSGSFHFQSFVHAIARKSFSNSPTRVGQNMKVVVKTNYCFAGHSKTRSGKRLSSNEVASKAQANLNYISRDGANRDLENKSSNLYRIDGSLMNSDEYSVFKQDLKEQDLSGFRRVMISVKDEVTREEMRQIVVSAMNDFIRETGKEAEGIFAIHTNTGHIHAHVLLISESFNTLRWTQNDLEHFKEIVHDREQQQIADRTLQTDRTIENEQQLNQDRSDDLENERNLQYDNSRIQ